MRSYLVNCARTAFAALLLHKLRSSLSILGVVCGVMAVLAILSIGAGAQRETLRRIEQMGMRNIFVRADNLTPTQVSRAGRYHSDGLQIEDLGRLETAVPGLQRTAAIRERTVDLFSKPDNLTPKVIEVTAHYARILGLPISSGRFIVDRDISDRNRVCVLGWAISSALGAQGKPGGMLRLGTDLWKVVGVMKPQDVANSDTARISLQSVNDMIIVPLGTMERAGLDAAEPLSELLVEFGDSGVVPEAARLIKRTLLVAHRGVDDFSIIVPLELLSQSQRIRRLFTIVFGAIGGLSLIIGGIGIMNIMLASVSERVKEIGLRRAVGAQPYHITLQFLMESVTLTVIGGLIGTIGGVGLALIVSLIAGWPVHFSPVSIVTPLLMAVATGCFFGLYPALKASRMDPLQALGYGV